MSLNNNLSRRDAICAVPVALEQAVSHFKGRNNEAPRVHLSNTLVFGPFSIDQWLYKAIDKAPLEGLMTKKGDDLPTEFKFYLEKTRLYIIDMSDPSTKPTQFISEGYPVAVTQLVDQGIPNSFEIGKKRVRVNVGHTTYSGLETQKTKNNIYVRSIGKIIISLDISITDGRMRTEYVYHFPSASPLITYSTAG